MKPLNEQPSDGTKEDKQPAPHLKLSFWSWCRQIFDGSSEYERLTPGGHYIQLEEPPFQGELLITMPANIKPTKMVFLGDWGDSLPEVQLVQLKQPWIEKRLVEPSHSMAFDVPEGFCVQVRQE